MKNYYWFLLLVALAPGCSATRPTPSISGFEDIPVPAGLTYQPAESITIEGPSAKAAHWVYRGRVKPESLRLAVRTTLEAHGWQHVITNSAPGPSTIQSFQKAGNSVQVDIYEGVWFTYLAIGAARALEPPQQTASNQPDAGAIGKDDTALPPVAPGSPSGSKSTWERTRDRIRSAWSALFSD